MKNGSPLLVYGINNCDTVKKALAWLSARQQAVVFQDFKKSPPTSAQIDRWLAHLPWEQLINRSGTMWRRLSPMEQLAVVDPASAKSLALQTPSVIKRPVVQWPNGVVTVGFKEADWSARLGQQQGGQ